MDETLPTGDSLRGQEPAMTTKEMVREIYSWAVIEKAAELPRRMTEMERWQNRVLGGVGVLIALNLLDRVAVFLTPAMIETAKAIASIAP